MSTPKRSASAVVEPPHPVVWVRWLDIVMDGHDTWLDPGEPLTGPALIDSIGMLIEETADLVVMLGHQAVDGERGHRTIIPRGCVVSITYLEPKA